MAQSETPPVTLAPWAPDDLPLVRRFLGDERMMRHLGGAQSEQQIREAHERFLATARDGAGVMFKMINPSGEVVGSVGYWDKEWRGDVVFETGWSVFPEHQGRGYAAHGAALAVDAARETHRHPFLHAFPQVDNAASNAICRRLGFTNLGECEFEYPKGHLLLCCDWELQLWPAE